MLNRGKLHGVLDKWYSNSIKASRYMYINDMIDGLCSKYFSNG